MADRIPDSLIDEILASAKKYSDESETVDYSAEKIDTLLAELSEDDDSAESVTEKTIVIPKTEEKTKNKFSLNFAEIETAQDEETETQIQTDESGQMELMDDGVEISLDTDEDEEVVEETEPELKSVSGQISIEKTRMFNEVEIRGAYNPNISHNLGNKVTRTTSGDAQPLASAPTQNFEKTIETPGVFVKKKNIISANTDGIEPLPTIVPVEYALEHNEPKTEPEIEDVFSDNQMVFDGFDEQEEKVIQTEAQAEEELLKARKDVVKDFVNGDLPFKDREIDEPIRKKHFDRQKTSVAREYFGPKDKIAVETVFEKEKNNLVIRTVALSIICFVMAILSAIAGAENGNFEIYGNNEYVYVAVQLLLLIAAGGLNYRCFINAFKNLKNKIFDMDTVISISVIAGFIQCVVGFAFTDSVESTACLMAGASLIPMIMKTVGELIRCKNDIGNFYIVSDEEYECYSVQNIDDTEAKSEITRGLMFGDSDIKFSTQIDFPARFVELSRSAEVTGALFNITVPVVTGIALLVGIIYGIVAKSFFAGISTFTGIVLMGLPAAASLISAVNIASENKKLNAEGTVINGYSAVEDAVNSNGVIIDACDAFMSGGCNIEGMKLYHKMRIDEAILYTASVVIASGGVLADVFDGVIIGKRELLFPVESLAYEEKLGCSCWIHNHRVLVGNRELLVHHNVETPDKELEEKFKNAGKNVIYLAIEGKISAMFVVVYKANEETARYMRELEKDGVTIFFRTADANITESFLEREFGLPSNVIKIINPVAGEMFTKVKNKQVERADAKIIHDGTVKTMLSALHSAFQISSYVNVSRTVQLVASFVGVAIVALLAFLSGLAQIGVWQIIIYQAVWAVVLSVLPKFRKS